MNGAFTILQNAHLRPFACRSYYHSEAELHRLFKSVNGIIFPGGLTDLWMDSPCERAWLGFHSDLLCIVFDLDSRGITDL